MRKNVRKNSSIKWRLFFPIIFIILFQAVMFTGVLALSGEFGYIQKFAYENLAEKTINRKNYIESEMAQRWSVITESVEDINSTIQAKLEENNSSIEDIKTDKELNIKIMHSIFDDVIYMMRRNTVNDAFVILDTGTLYGNEENPAKACIYLRDSDPSENSGRNNSDIFMEIGYSEIVYQQGITFDTGWKINFEDNKCSDNSFYTETIKNAQEYPNLSLKSKGYWSGFSSVTEYGTKTMKYTLPLIDKNGTIYGVAGIGITESTLMKKIPSNDLFNESAVYIIAKKNSDEDAYGIQMHSGSSYSKLVGRNNKLSKDKAVSENIVSFESDKDVNVVGCIQSIKLYNSDSPYSDEEWALISVAEDEKVLKVYTNLLNMLLLSLGCSIVGGIGIAFAVSRQISRPLTDISAYLEKTAPEEHLDFKYTHITEIDQLTNAIEELQISVEESASRVSQVISLVDIGIGVFIYDRIKQNMFVSQTCVNMLWFKNEAKDTNMKLAEFIAQLRKLDFNHEFFKDGNIDIVDMSNRILKTKNEEGHARWFKFNIVSDEKKLLGAIQDVTAQTIEKKRIEYERDYDITTGLLNRRAYYNKVAERFRDKSKLKIAAFLMIDLDNLKYVNDTYGHDFGDDYIKTAANVLKKFNEHNAVVSRLSGDEFNVFLSGFDTKEEIREIIEDIRGQLLNSYCLLLDGSHYKIRASAGISWYPENSESYEQLMKYADFAMYTIKNTTKGSIAEFDMSAYKKDLILVTGIEEMNRIIDEYSVKYSFHSIVDARTGNIYGYEALMRPHSEVLKSPVDFIRLAKTDGKLNDVEKLTWLCSIKSFTEQIKCGNIKPDVKLFVNSIPNCIISDKCIATIENGYRNILHNIVLEVLESEQSNDEYAKKKQSFVKKWGGMTALDDFGTGYNSEYALITSNPDIIKIDRSIISGCENDESRQSLIRSIIRIARNKNIMVLAEGVETYQEMKMVINYGVDLLQGYYIDRPVFEPSPISEEIVSQIRELNAKG